MKTIKTKLLMVALMLGTLTNYANNSNLLLDTKKVKVEFKNAKKGHLLIIKNNDGKILHSEEIEKEGNLVKVFDFSELENGNYSMELEKDFEIVIKSVEIKNNKVIFDEDSKRVIFKPVIRNEKNRLMISKISFDKKPLQVNLFYKNELIFSETVISDAILNRVYKLDKQKQGDYRVVVRNNNRSYTNEFKL